MELAQLLNELHTVIDRVLAVQPAALGGDELRAFTVGVQAERSRLEVAAGEVAAGWETSGSWAHDGTLSAALAVGREARCDHQRVKSELRRAHRLAATTELRRAVLEGRLSLDHVDLFLRYATKARWQRFLADEAMLVALCEGLRLFDDCRRAVQYWAMRVDADLDLRRDDAPDPSRLYFSRASNTGEGVLNGVLSAVDAEIVERELVRLMATRSINATGVAARPLFQVIVGDDTASHLCELASGHVVRPADLVSYIDTAVVESFLFDGPSTVIAKSNARTFTGALRKAIQVRDRRCQHRSQCPAPASVADVDHRRPASEGGATSQFNGRVECIPHNRLAHLHDHPGHDPDPPERTVGPLDALRCRLRWQALHDPEWLASVG